MVFIYWLVYAWVLHKWNATEYLRIFKLLRKRCHLLTCLRIYKEMLTTSGESSSNLTPHKQCPRRSFEISTFSKRRLQKWLIFLLLTYVSKLFTVSFPTSPQTAGKDLPWVQWKCREWWFSISTIKRMDTGPNLDNGGLDLCEG